MARKIFDENNPLTGIREAYEMDDTDDTLHKKYSQNVDQILAECKDARDRAPERNSGSCYKRLLTEKGWVREGAIPFTAFFGGTEDGGVALCKRDPKDTLLWLEENKDFKTTNAKLI